MEVEFDAGRGRKLGSRIRMSGRVFGIELTLEEVVTERVPPRRKVWETQGVPRLLVIGHYRMGFEIAPHGENSMLQVFIEYALPEGVPGRWLGRLLGRYYAKWCTQRMLDDAMKHFAPPDVTDRHQPM